MNEDAAAAADIEQPKGGAPERGTQGSVGTCQTGISPSGSIFVGSLLLAGLSIHSVMEGITLGAAPNPHAVALAILFHKTLEAFAVGSSLLHGEKREADTAASMAADAPDAVSAVAVVVDTQVDVAGAVARGASSAITGVEWFYVYPMLTVLLVLLLLALLH